MTMSKKDFELIAVLLRDFPRTDDEYETWCAGCHKFADALATTNPRFDRARFLEACGAATGADNSHAERKIAKRRQVQP